MILPDDLRLRLLAGLGLLLLIAPLAHPGPAAAAVAAALALFAAERRAVPWRRLWHLEAFLLLLLLTLPFTVPGPPLWQWGPLRLSAEGLARTLVIGLKVTASVLLLALLLGSAEPERIGAALRSLGLPEALVRIHLGSCVISASSATRCGVCRRRCGSAPFARGRAGTAGAATAIWWA